MSYCRMPCCASLVSFFQGFDDIRSGLQVIRSLACHVVTGHLDQEQWPSFSQCIGFSLIQRSPDAILIDANGPRKVCVAHYDHEEAKGANGWPIEHALTRGLELMRIPSHGVLLSSGSDATTRSGEPAFGLPSTKRMPATLGVRLARCGQGTQPATKMKRVTTKTFIYGV